MTLHHKIGEVCRIAVSVNADDDKFPEHWLFKHRWGKGKKKAHTLKLPSGDPATIKWVTVGGRTSAYVAELQFPPAELSSTSEKCVSRKRVATNKRKKRMVADEESDLTPLSSESDTEKPFKKRTRINSVPPIQTISNEDT